MSGLQMVGGLAKAGGGHAWYHIRDTLYYHHPELIHAVGNIGSESCTVHFQQQ
jgi:hypothetical protein